MVTSTAGVVNEGSVTFTLLLNDTTAVGTPVSAMVTAGAASATYSLPAGTGAGSYTVKAVYGGTGNFMSSTDHAQNLTLSPALTTTIVQSGSSTFSVTQPQSVTVMATVSSSAGTVNEGTETFTVLDQPPPPGAQVIPSGGEPGSISPFLVLFIGTPVTVPVMNGIAS